MEVEKKNVWASKTIWVNLIMAIFSVIAIWVPAVSEYVNESNLVLVFSIVNIILRGATKGAVEFK